MNHWIFTQDWENKLQNMLLNCPTSSNTWAYICSPLRANRMEQMQMHMKAAAAYMYYSYVMLGIPAKAPHAFLPYLLNDGVPSERGLALDFGIRLLGQSGIMLVCGDRISSGMQDEIIYALKLNMQITAFDQKLADSIRMLAKGETGITNEIQFNNDHPFMGFPAQKFCRFLNSEGRDAM